MPLRPYQIECLTKIKERWLEGVSRQLIVKATGLGKTVTFANIPSFLGTQDRTLVMVHREELAVQAADKIKEWNPTLRVGTEMGDRESDNSDDIIVAGVQTLYTNGFKRLERLLQRTKFGLVVPDEAHHYTAAKFKETLTRTMEKNPKALLCGFTATPNRGDGQGLIQMFDEITYNYGMLDAMKDGWLCDLRGFRIRTDVTLDEVHTSDGDFQRGELSKAVNTPARNDLIVREWLKQAKDRQTLSFTVDIQHAKDLADTFRRYGVASEAVWGTDPDRKEKIRCHKAGGLQHLANSDVLAEGYDDWRIGCVIHAKPTKSQLRFAQEAGRGTRTPDGVNLHEARKAGLTLAKEDCILLDVTDNTSRHTLATLASLFGLPAKLDMKGKTVVQTVQAVEAATAAKPEANIEAVENFEQLNAVVQHVDLFEVKFPKEVTENSALQWHPTPQGNYVLLLPAKGEKVMIYKDLLGHWNIKGTVEGSTFEGSKHDLTEAFMFADKNIKFLGRSVMTLLQRDNKAKWKQQPVSEKQRNAIYWLCRRKGIPQPDYTKMTSGEASQYIGAQAARR